MVLNTQVILSELQLRFMVRNLLTGSVSYIVVSIQQTPKYVCSVFHTRGVYHNSETPDDRHLCNI